MTFFKSLITSNKQASTSRTVEVKSVNCLTVKSSYLLRNLGKVSIHQLRECDLKRHLYVIAYFRSPFPYFFHLVR